MLLKSLWEGQGEYRSCYEGTRVPETHMPEKQQERFRKLAAGLDSEEMIRAAWEWTKNEVGEEGRFLLPAVECMRECLHEYRDVICRMDLQQGQEQEADRLKELPEIIPSGRFEWKRQSEEYIRALARLGLASRQSQAALPIRTIRQYMREHYSEDLTLEDMAGMVHMTPAYISGLFRKEAGKNFTAELQDLRMSQAKKLLKDPRLQIAEVAERVGYTDARYFSKLFTRSVGITPKEYRRLHG